MTAETSLPTCYRHPDRETRLACSSCGRPVCVDCVQAGAVGQFCPVCAAERGAQRVVTSAQLRRGAQDGAPVTLGILGVAVALFLAGMLLPGVDRRLFVLFAQINQLVAAGEWYRIFTAAFLHAGLTHILFNMWALWVLGPQLERMVGSGPFAALYVAATAAGGMAFFLFGGDGLAVGASGAIFGLFGAWLVATYRRRHTVTGAAGFRQLVVLLGINLALPLIVPGIAWQAHLGGLVTGIVVVLLWGLPGLRHAHRRTSLRAAVALAAALLALVPVIA